MRVRILLLVALVAVLMPLVGTAQETTPTPVVPTPMAAGCDDIPQYVETRVAHYNAVLEEVLALLGLTLTSAEDETSERIFSMSALEAAQLVQLYTRSIEELEAMEVPAIAAYYHEQTLVRYTLTLNIFKESQGMGILAATLFYGDALVSATTNALTYLRAAERICPAFAGLLEADPELANF